MAGLPASTAYIREGVSANRTVATIDIPDDWTPTPANINALPFPLRRYIHDLSTVCDPAGDVRKLFQLKQENKMLRWECERLAGIQKVSEPPR